MMTRTYLLLLFLSLALYGNAQSISQEVTASSGERISNGGASLNFTLGEPVVGDISTSATLNQGFWSGATNLFVGIEDFELDLETIVAPNPVVDFLNIRLDEVAEKNYQIQVIDMSGRTMNTSTLFIGETQALIDFTRFSSGAYLVKIEELETKRNLTYQIIK